MSFYAGQDLTKHIIDLAGDLSEGPLSNYVCRMLWYARCIENVSNRTGLRLSPFANICHVDF